MDYENKYKDALDLARTFYEGYIIQGHNGEAGILAEIFPELKSEDERIKREILELVSIAGNGNQFEEIKDWLERLNWLEHIDTKLNDIRTDIERLGVISYDECYTQAQEETIDKASHWLSCMFTKNMDSVDFNDRDEFIKDFERVVKKKCGGIIKLSEEEQNRFAKGVLTSCALSFIDYLDAHKYEGKMCVSNGECEDIENAFHNAMWDKLHRYYCKYIEKQGEKDPCIGCTNDKGCVACENGNLKEIKIEPKFKVGNWYQCIKDFFGKGVTFDKNTAYYCAQEGCLQDEYGCHIAIVKYLYDNFKLWTIQDAKGGDVLAFDNDTIVIFKDLYNSSTFHSYCHIEGGLFDVSKDDMPDWWEGKGFHPATKEQRDLLFQKMKEAGYEWDAEKKKLNKIEQKLTDKVEPKFHEGEWITDGEKVWKIGYIEDDMYIEHRDPISGGGAIKSIDEHYHLWTINDAKDGDVLADDSCIFIIQKLGDNNTAKIYCILHDDGDFNFDSIIYLRFHIDSTKPATKEQRDLLFQKMKEAGYEWDDEKKELKKKESKKLDAAEVFEWLEENSTLFGANWCHTENIIEQFKEDFDL